MFEMQVDGRPSSEVELLPFAGVNDGHFTAMQIRGGAVRGIQLHLDRLSSAHLELFNEELDTDLVRARMRAAVVDHPNSYLRTTITAIPGGHTSVLVIVRPPIDPDSRALSLLPVSWTRAFPHIKHVGSFPQIEHARRARGEGFDDALLMAPDGRISETTIANVAFVAEDRLVWPDGPALRGICWQLLERAAHAVDLRSTTAPVRLSDVSQFAAVVTANSIGLTRVHAIGDLRLSVSEDRVAQLIEIYESLPFDPL